MFGIIYFKDIFNHIFLMMHGLKSLHFTSKKMETGKLEITLSFLHFSTRSMILFFSLLILISFFYIHKKKVLDSRKFLTSGFRLIYTFWDVLNTVWPFLEIVCPSVCLSLICISPKFCWRCISRTNAQKIMKLYIQVHINMIWG